MAACPNCGSALQDGARFCPACGTTLGASCASCGSALAVDAVFCPSCGTPVSPTSTPIPTPVATQSAPPAPGWPAAAQPAYPPQQQAAPPPQYAPQQGAVAPPPQYPPQQQAAPPPQYPPQQQAAPPPQYSPQQAWPGYPPQQPQAMACLACSSPLRPGARFCRACGTPAGAAAPPPGARQWQQAGPRAGATPAFDIRTVAMALAFGLVFIGAFLAWLSRGDVSVKPFDEGGYFRITDWLVSDDVTSPPPHWDGIVTIVLAVFGLGSCGLATFGTGGVRSAGKFLLGLAGPLVAAFFSIQLQFILSRPNSDVGIGDIGIGLWLIGAAAAIATVARFIPAGQR